MISLQPIQLVNYIGFKRSKVPNQLKRLFYLSFEDALWDLLKHKMVKIGSTVLVPEFFCGDVENNIKLHGYKICHYRVEKDLLVDMVNFEEKIKIYHPSVIIIFHPVGITTSLFMKRSWLRLLNKDTLLIEDCVHRTIDPQKIVICKHNHFLINSLRKVVPLQGSSIYGLKDDLNFSPPPFYQSTIYSFKVNLLWFFMTLAANVGATALAEKLMIQGYQLIGDSKLPAKGGALFKLLEEFLDYAKIEKIKIEQAKLYQEKLKNLTQYYPSYHESDFAKMRVWPLILNKDIATKIIYDLRKHGLLVRFELNDSEWSKKQKIIYLPMGPHITHDNQIEISQKVLQAFD